MPMGRQVAWAALCAGVLAALPSGAAAVQQTQETRGRVVRLVRPEGWIGVTIDMDLQQAWQAGAPAASPRWVISQVYDGSPADRLLQVGDTILRINRRPVSVEALDQLQASLEPGDAVSFQVRREGRLRTVAIRAANRPADEELETLPPQVRVQVRSAQAALLQHLDSAARFGLLSPGPEPRTLVMVRSPGDSMVLALQSRVGAARARSGDAFDGSWTFGVRPSPGPFEGVVARQAPAQVAGQQPRRQPPEPAVRQAELDMVRAGMAEAARTIAEIEQHRRPLAPYILGQDVIAGAKLAPLNPDLAEYFGVGRGTAGRRGRGGHACGGRGCALR